ncbi:MAG: hypothetical protein RLZZ455_236 [Candidatus Parcubacteria bacterium]|jgi:hypothetical protein
MVQKGGSRKDDSRVFPVVIVTDEFSEIDRLRLSLQKPVDLRDASDRARIKKAGRAGVDLDAVRVLTPDKIAEFLRLRETPGKSEIGKKQEHGRQTDFLSQKKTESPGVAIPRESVSGSVDNSAVRIVESTTIVESMDQLAGVWREMRDSEESSEKKDEGNMFLMPISSQDLQDDSRIHDGKLGAGERVSLHFDRPKWRPLTRTEEPQGEPHIIDPWNAEAIAAGECVFQAYRRSEVIEGTSIDVQPGLAEILPPDAFVYAPDKFDIRETQSRQPSHRRWVRPDISRRTELRREKQERSQIARVNEMIASARRPERR